MRSTSGERAWYGEAPRRPEKGVRSRAFVFASAIAMGLALAGHQLRPLPLETFLLVYLALLAASFSALLAGAALRDRRQRRGLLLHHGILSFSNHGGRAPAKVLDLTGPFGVTALANRSRSRGSLAITTRTGSFYVSGRFDDRTRASLRATLASAFTVASDERALEAAAPDGYPLELDGPTFGRFFTALRTLDPRCTQRLFLSGHQGDAVTVDDHALVVGERLFDLNESLEWHGALFREQAFGAMSVFQLTFVRQGEHEVAFVSLMPALSAPSCPGDVNATAEPELERAVLRDMGLLNVGVEDAPPAHLRVAIERVFMLPLRAALDGAPAATTGRKREPGETRAAS